MEDNKCEKNSLEKWRLRIVCERRLGLNNEKFVFFYQIWNIVEIYHWRILTVNLIINESKSYGILNLKILFLINIRFDIFMI